MDNSEKNNQTIEMITKAILTLVYLGGFVIFVVLGFIFGPGLKMFNISTLDLVMLALATMRLGRMVAFDHIAEPLRMPFAKTIADRNGAGSIVVPKGKGFVRSIGQLISCPICVGTWIAAGLVYLLYFFPGPTRVFIVVAAVVGLAELLHSATEALCWVGIDARVTAGGKMRANMPVSGAENSADSGDQAQ